MKKLLLSFVVSLLFPACRDAHVEAEVTRISLAEGQGLPAIRVTTSFANASGSPCRLESYFLEDEPHKVEAPGLVVPAGGKAEHTAESKRISPKTAPKDVKVRDVSCPAE